MVKAANKASKDQTGLPTGVAAALQGATGARVQVLVSAAACFEAQLGTVKQVVHEQDGQPDQAQPVGGVQLGELVVVPPVPWE